MINGAMRFFRLVLQNYFSKLATLNNFYNEKVSTIMHVSIKFRANESR